MKSILMLTLVLGTSTVFAGQADLKLWNTLTSLGIQAEGGMGGSHILIKNVVCRTSNLSKSTSCRMNSEDIESGRTLTTVVNGRKATKILNYLVATLPDEVEGGMGHTIVGATEVRCSQVAKGLRDGQSEAETTTCDAK